MSDFILGHHDIGYKAVFTGGTWATGLGLEMFNRQLITAVARTLDTTSFDLDITLQSSIDIEVLGLVNHNLSSTGTYQWRAYQDSGRTILLYDSGSIIAGNYYDAMQYQTDVVATDQSYDTVYWRLTLDDVGNPQGFYSIGRLFLGERFYPDRNMKYGLALGVEETNSDLNTSQVGIETFVDAPNKRTAVFSFDLMRYDKGNDFFRFSMRNGIIGACLFEFNPEDKQEGLRTFICRQKTLNPLNYVSYNINEFSIGLVEII